MKKALLVFGLILLLLAAGYFTGFIDKSTVDDLLKNIQRGSNTGTTGEKEESHKSETPSMTETFSETSTAPGESSSETTSAEWDQTETSSPGQGTTPTEGELKNFFDHSYSLGTLSFTEGDYDYKGMKIIPEKGRLYYFPYTSSLVYLVSGKIILAVSPWDDDFLMGSKATPEIGQSSKFLIVLPIEPEKLSILTGEGTIPSIIATDGEGRLHIFIDPQQVEGDEINWYIPAGHVVYNFDATGVGIGEYGTYREDYNIYLAWKGRELRVYTYSHRTLEDIEEGKNVTVEPAVYTLPEEIRDANAMLYDNFILVLTGGGTYLVPSPYGRYANDTNVYRIDGRVDMITGCGTWGEASADPTNMSFTVYSSGRLYVLRVLYSEEGRKVTVTREASMNAPNIVGIFSPMTIDGSQIVAVSDSSGALKVYHINWSKETGRKEFNLLQQFKPGVPLVKFRFGNFLGAMANGVGRDGAFYVIVMRQSNT